MYYSEIKQTDIANGVGVRVTLFVSGCTRHCKGCFNPETWSFSNGLPFTAETEELLLQALKPSYIGGLTLLFRAMLLAYNGNIEIYVPMTAIAEVIAIGFATYLAVALLHIRRIKRVPLALALKVQE